MLITVDRIISETATGKLTTEATQPTDRTLQAQALLLEDLQRQWIDQMDVTRLHQLALAKLLDPRTRDTPLQTCTGQ